MIFDEVNRQSAHDGLSGRRRRRSSGRRSRDDAKNRRSSFQSASRLSTGPVPSDRNTRAWLWVMGLILLGAAAFTVFLHHEKGSAVVLPGEAPSNQLEIFVDPLLAPLETGAGGYDPARLAAVSGQIAAARAGVGLDDREIYNNAGTLAAILQEAADDRARHLQRLVDLGSPVLGLSDGKAPARTDLAENARRHHELAVAVSWQRNSGTYRNRIDELMARLVRLESGRFRSGPPAPPPSHE